MSEDLSQAWKEEIEALSPEDLAAEITREQTVLDENRKSFDEAGQRLHDLEEEIEREKLRPESERWISRQRTIERLRSRIENRRSRIRELRETALMYERISPLTSVVQRYIRLETAAYLWRTITALRGWQTRDSRALRSYEGWQTREEPQTRRIRQLLEDYEKWRVEQNRLANMIAAEEKMIDYKESLVRYFRVQKAREYYALEPGKDTPEPFAEYRVWVYTRSPKEWTEDKLAELLNELEWVISLNVGRTHIIWAQAVDFSQNYESRPVDDDEVDAPLDEPQYHVRFYKAKGAKRDWVYRHNEVLGWIMGARSPVSGVETRQRDAIRQTYLEDWRSRTPPERKRQPRRRRR